MKIINHTWGTEVVVGAGARVVRLYHTASKGKLTIDLSQVRDKKWDKYVATMAKYNSHKVVVTKTATEMLTIAKWWAE